MLLSIRRTVLELEPLLGPQLRACLTHRLGPLDAGNLMPFYSIYALLQLGLSQQSQLNPVPHALLAAQSIYLNSIIPQAECRSFAQGPSVSALCVSYW